MKVLRLQINLAFFFVSLQQVSLTNTLSVIIQKYILEIFCPKALSKDGKSVGHKAKLPFHISSKTHIYELLAMAKTSVFKVVFFVLMTLHRGAFFQSHTALHQPLSKPHVSE